MWVSPLHPRLPRLPGEPRNSHCRLRCMEGKKKKKKEEVSSFSTVPPSVIKFPLLQYSGGGVGFAILIDHFLMRLLIHESQVGQLHDILS